MRTTKALRGLTAPGVLGIALMAAVAACGAATASRSPGSDSEAFLESESRHHATWLADFERAQANARLTGRPVLMNFSGSDWCGWCIRLDEEVFRNDEFIEYAREHLVLFKADFPRLAALPESVAGQNEILALKFGVRGFPTIVLLDPDGSVIARTGYMAGGAEAYVEHLRELLAARLDAGSDDVVVDSGAGDRSRLFEVRATLWSLLAMFLAGLALNLTPCVYPMLAVTVSIFGSRNERRVGRGFAVALVYVLGIATMYSLLGMTAALTGGMFGGLLQNPWTLALIGLLLGAMSLSMFGFYELRLPAAAVNRLGGVAATGIAGIYLSGLLVGIFAAPCIGPPVVGLLAVAGASGDPLYGFSSFFVLSFGLGAPYLVLGAFSGLLRRMPRAGEWMLWVKKAFGVILLGLGLFYLGLGLAPGLLPWIPPVILAAGGAYLGFMDRTGNERRNFRRLKWAIGIAAIAYGIWLPTAAQRAKPDWLPYHPERVNAARIDGRPVMMYFYADWCIPCRQLEQQTFSDPDVIAALSGHSKMRVDMTRGDVPIYMEAAERHSVHGVPTIVFLDERGEELENSRVVGFLTPGDLIDRVASLASD